MSTVSPNARSQFATQKVTADARRARDGHGAARQDKGQHRQLEPAVERSERQEEAAGAGRVQKAHPGDQQRQPGRGAKAGRREVARQSRNPARQVRLPSPGQSPAGMATSQIA